MRYLGNHHDTEDVLSMAYTRIFRRIQQLEYRGQGSLLKWVTTIVIHEALRFLENKKQVIFQEDESLLMKSAALPAPIDVLDLEEVARVLDEMPKGYRRVFNLFAIEGYSHKEIADMLKISENTSKSQLSKARNYMIQKLKSNMPCHNGK